MGEWAGRVGAGYAAFDSSGAAVKGLGSGGDVKATSGVLETVDLFNLDAATAYLQIFDAVDHTHVTLGTTTPNMVLPIAASASRTIPLIKYGFNNGLVFAVTTTATGSSSPATGLIVNATYA